MLTTSGDREEHKNNDGDEENNVAAGGANDDANCEPSNTRGSESGNNNINSSRQRQLVANGSCKRQPEDKVANGTATAAGASPCPHAKSQSVVYANEEPPPHPPPLRAVSDHVQFLITEKQKPRTDDGSASDVDTRAETTLNSDIVGVEELEDWKTGE